MSVADQAVTDRYAIYQGDCVEVLATIPDESVGLSIYSPPFAGLYHYSSSEQDMSNCRSYEEFMRHYAFVVRELARTTMPGRITLVHCTDIPSGNTGRDHLHDFPGDIIRLHEAHGFKFSARYAIWKDPFVVYIRTLAKGLRHRTCTEDSARVSVASADYLLAFRRDGANREPIAHPTGLLEYAGSTEVPGHLLKYRGWKGKQTENKFSQWVWRQYASSIWNDVRLERILPFRESKDPEDEKHVHPLQLDVIDRAVVLWSNPGDTVLTPFMGVGSEVYGAVTNGRRGIGIELKPSYFRQAKLNVEAAAAGETKPKAKQADLFAKAKPENDEVWVDEAELDEADVGT